MNSRSLLAMTIVSALVLPALAENAVYLKNGRTIAAKTIEWREGAQEYVITTAETTMPIPRAQVARAVVDKPAEYDQAVSLLRSRLFAQAIPLLESVVRKYRMLDWDAEASKLLAQAYMEANESKKAVAVMDNLLTLVPYDQIPVSLRMTYWKALLASGAHDQLRRELDKVIGAGMPDAVATAYLMRANLFLKLGEDDAALSDFLKLITLYPAQKAVQPEALYRAAELFDGIRDPRGAEFRAKLAKEYASSEWASKPATVKPAASAAKPAPAAAAPAAPVAKPAAAPAPAKKP
jgi:tetratricopeptide (TPR) repeat protein